MEQAEVTRDSLMKLAADFDAGKVIDEPQNEAPVIDPDQPAVERLLGEKPKKDEPAEAAKTEGKAESDSSLKESKTEADKPKSDAETKPKSKYANEQERRAKTWQEINAEKEALKAEKEAIAREREQWQQQRVTQSQDKLKDEKGFSADDYSNFAKKCREAGDADSLKLAIAAEERANQLQKQEQEVRAKAQHEQTAKAWQQKYVELSSKIPELKDPNTETYKATVELIKRYPALASHADGLEAAVDHVLAKAEAKTAKEKDTTIKELKEQLQSLQKKLSIGPGTPEAPLRESKSFDELPLAEQRKRLQQAAASADRDAGLA